MDSEIKKCETCGHDLKQSGPYASTKKEGEKSEKGPDIIYFYCNNEKCPDFNKNIKEIVFEHKN